MYLVPVNLGESSQGMSSQGEYSTLQQLEASLYDANSIYNLEICNAITDFIFKKCTEIDLSDRYYIKALNVYANDKIII